MERNIKIQAIVVRTSKYGELHKIVTLLSPQLGLVSAIIYGGRKGKKTAIAPLFSIGEFQLYNNPVKKEYSIEESVLSFIPTAINEDLESTYTASFMCELVTKTPSDDSKEIFDLLQNALQVLEINTKNIIENSTENNDENSKCIAIAFMWKLIQIWGLAPNLDYCPSCDRKYEEDEILSFSFSFLVPVCKNCGDNTSFILPPGARRYLRYTLVMSFDDACKVKLNAATQVRIFSYMTQWIKMHINAPLKTLENWIK